MQFDTTIIGAGAAGMMCAAHAPGRVLILDHARKPGEKIRISGGGRCNFTNLHCGPHAFLSQNPHFAKSALALYTQWDFIDLVEQHGIAWHEKTLGQLFCDNSAKDIIAMLLDLMAQNGVSRQLETAAERIEPFDQGYQLTLVGPTGQQTITTHNLIIATGGKSIPKIGATGFAYDVARQFGIPVTETRAGLVPFTFSDQRFAALSGVATPTRLTANKATFEEAILFTHRGLSGPAVLQASSYWCEGQSIMVNLDPADQFTNTLRQQRQTEGRRLFKTELARLLPTKLVAHLASTHDLSGNLADWSDKRLAAFLDQIKAWPLTPSGTEGYRTAEVTVGGIDTQALSSKTMATKSHPNLYFIGEAVDVTGWLGGYNFQWAWSSAMAAARSLG